MDERYLIQGGILGGLTASQIARQLRRDRSVIYDELARGKDGRGKYCPHVAQLKRGEASARSAANCVKKPEAAWRLVGERLMEGWSPEQVSGRWKRLRLDVQISIPAIYAAAVRNGWEQYLHRQRVRARLKRPARHPWGGSARSIHERSKDANLRIEMGHWEADTMAGKQKDKKRILHMVERQSLYWELVLLNGTRSVPTVKKIQKRLENNGLPFKTVATDRGAEFTATGTVLGEKAFACDAYSPDQRATNENQIGVLRIDLPKGVTMDSLKPKHVRRLQEKYNNLPRKCLGFLTPYEVAFNRQPPVGTRT
ncbi:MAG: IS30 family transposase [Betaproteobacteria bacterium]|nr:IS30 family transposase [Betaproteobacteria bacterium]